MIENISFAENTNLKTFNNPANKKSYSHINFYGKGDSFVKKNIVPNKTGLLYKLKLLFKNKENIKNAKRAGINIEEYEKNLEKLFPNRNYDFVDYMPLGNFPSCTETKSVINELDTMIKRIDYWNAENINIFKQEDEKQIKIMINDIKNKILSGKNITDEELEIIGDFWYDKVLYPHI